MLKNYFIIAFRNIRRNKLRTFVHLLGLSLGIAICLLIFNVVWHAYSFDKFHPDSDRIFRINTIEEWETGNIFQTSGTNGRLGEVIDEELSMIEKKGRLYALFEVMVVIPEQNKVVGRSNKVAFANPGLFEIFQRKWLAGNPQTALLEPNSAVISESSLEKYFPGSKANEILGKEILWIDASDSIYAQVHGVVADYTENSDFIFTDFISFSTISNSQKEDWYGLQSWTNLNTSSQLFVKVSANSGKASLDEGLAVLAKKYYNDSESHPEFIGEPLTEMHFSENFDDTAISKTLLNGLIYIGIIILLLACLNFVNLETALAINRAKEVGIRKTLGSDRGQLVFQFLSETFVLVGIASIFAVFMADQIQVYFKGYFPGNFQFTSVNTLSLGFLFVNALVLTGLTGLYPALFLSKYQPQRALKGELSQTRGFSLGVFLRKNLSVLQFTASIAFIIMVAVLSNQMKYITSQPLGFSKEAVLFTQLPFMGDKAQRELLANRIRNESFVEGVSLSGNLASSNSIWTSDAYAMVEGQEKQLNVHVMNVDSAFVTVHEIPILAGNSLGKTAQEIVVNRNFLKELGAEDPHEVLGAVIRFGRDENTIVGVVDNFNARSLREGIMPMILTNRSDYQHLLIVKLSGQQNLAYAKERLEFMVNEVYPFEEGQFTFLDEVVEGFYEDDKKIRGVLGFAAFIALLISVLGLFGLSSFTISLRTKEISIRKVLGAGILQLITLISKQYVVLVSVSFVLAVIPAYYFSSNWLQRFAYRIDMPFQLFAGVGLAVLLLALLVVGFHSYEVAKTNPAKVLKSE
ncbi:ABC transporter permease [Cecembia rubra]|uniref:ABC-type lipoprotein release transport system permease subunit n=1 Tax=Cecembia rubra TaxID=1485585 RepID=A0A2P8EDY4_9BACT|nr:ABC transporter permease [Cecembia rubra]PSL07696.1 ABC-type lipoprotein release transport system permease subunit [Cecembia rubra]